MMAFRGESHHAAPLRAVFGNGLIKAKATVQGESDSGNAAVLWSVQKVFLPDDKPAVFSIVALFTAVLQAEGQ